MAQQQLKSVRQLDKVDPGEIWADMEARLTHVGPSAYTGSLIQALQVTGEVPSGGEG